MMRIGRIVVAVVLLVAIATGVMIFHWDKREKRDFRRSVYEIGIAMELGRILQEKWSAIGREGLYSVLSAIGDQKAVAISEERYTESELGFIRVEEWVIDGRQYVVIKPGHKGGVNYTGPNFDVVVDGGGSRETQDWVSYERRPDAVKRASYYVSFLR